MFEAGLLPDDLAAYQRDTRDFLDEIRNRPEPVVLPGDMERTTALMERLRVLVEKYA